MSDAPQTVWSQLYAWLTSPLFSIGETSLSLANLLKFALFVIALIWIGLKLRRTLQRRVLPGMQVDAGVADTLGNIAGYTVIALGLLIGVQTLGVKLSTLNVVFGALGIGIGFGLQTVAANFVAGVIILLERPIHIGDRVQLQDLHGRVTKIHLRATEVLTNDNISVLVPNSEFISQQVINWSRSGNRIRVRVPVHVAYGSDPERVRAALLEAAASLDAVLKEPKPEVRLTKFGDSSLEFELLGWTREMLQRRGAFISLVNFSVLEALRRHEIEIPYPRRDVKIEWAAKNAPWEDPQAPEPNSRTAAGGDT